MAATDEERLAGPPCRSALQKLAVLWVVAGPLLLMFINSVCLLNPLTAILWFGYLIFINGPGLKAASRSEGWIGLRRWSLYKHFASYFPITMHKEQELDPAGKYMFIFHPHGIFHPLNVFGHFDTDWTIRRRLFPGLRIHALTMTINFRIPIWREFMLWHGVRDVSRSSCLKLLSRPGRSVLLVVGGAQESEFTEPHTMDLVLLKRKGFVRLALETGAALVPLLGFGENELWDIIHFQPGTFWYNANRLVRKSCGFTLPRFCGVSWSGKGWGFLPRPIPLHTVVGAPIQVPKFDGSTKNNPAFAQLVDEYHAKYIAALQALYHAHKDKFAADRKSELQLVQ